MPTPTTANRGYQKPDPANKLNVDVLRLAAALDAKASQTDVDAKFGLRTAIYTTAGAQTWVCPTGVTRAKVTVIGGGGNGGSSGSSGAGGGGGGGGTSIKYFTNLVPGTTYSMTVGAQGAASTFVGPGGVTPTGNGGANGSGASVGPAGAGGTATGGDLNLGGEGGQAGAQLTAGALSGRGGSSSLGGGGRSVTIISGQVAGVAGAAPGAGGGGAAAISGTSQAGGAGQPGAVIIEY